MTNKHKRRKKHMKSIILQKPGTCLICEVCGIQGIPNTNSILERHHVFFGTSRRAKSEANGLTVMLCRDHHWIVHNDNQWNMWLKKYTQAAWEMMPGHTRAGWMEMLGKNYLDEEESMLVSRIKERNNGGEQTAASDEIDAGQMEGCGAGTQEPVQERDELSGADQAPGSGSGRSGGEIGRGSGT